MFQLQRQLTDRGSGISGICLSDQESLVSFPRGSINGAATPGAGSSSGCVISQSQQNNNNNHGSINELLAAPSLNSTLGNTTSSNIIGHCGQAGDRGSCSADSGVVRGSSDRESGGATSVGGNLSDSTTDGMIFFIFL